MQKEKYERSELEIIAFSTGDMLLISDPDDYEGWNPNNPGGSGGDPNEGWNPY